MISIWWLKLLTITSSRRILFPSNKPFRSQSHHLTVVRKERYLTLYSLLALCPQGSLLKSTLTNQIFQIQYWGLKTRLRQSLRVEKVEMTTSQRELEVWVDLDGWLIVNPLLLQISRTHLLQVIKGVKVPYQLLSQDSTSSKWIKSRPYFLRFTLDTPRVERSQIQRDCQLRRNQISLRLAPI